MVNLIVAEQIYMWCQNYVIDTIPKNIYSPIE